MFNLKILVNFILILILVLGFIIFIFWRFGIFKKETKLGEILNIKTQIEFVNSYSYQDLTNYLQNLPTTKIEIPDIKPEELGRQDLF